MIDHIYPDFESETYCVLHNNGHRWYYISDQRRDEVLLMTNYDSETHRSLLYFSTRFANYYQGAPHM